MTIERQSESDPAELYPRTAACELDLVIPVYNEQKDLAPAVRRLHEYAVHNLRHSFRITIADNASTDDTWQIATDLADEYPEVEAFHLDEKGRGRALKAVWSRSDSDVLVYMDVDLSTGLNALATLVAPLLSGHSQIGIGTRLAQSSNVVRGAKRELISRMYNVILRRAVGVHFSDAQCGFKAIRRDAAAALLPLVDDDNWFFDTELLVLAERCGMRIHEVPVDWVDDPNSTVHIRSTAIEDLRGIARLQRSLRRGALPLDEISDRFRPPITAQPRSTAIVSQLAKFAGIGVISTIAYALLFLVFSGFTNSQVANFGALLVTAVANTALNRRFTFGVQGRGSLGRHHLQGLGVFLLGWAITSLALMTLHDVDPHPAALVEVIVLTGANAVATVARFVLLRGWVFKKGPRGLETELGSRPAQADGARG